MDRVYKYSGTDANTNEYYERYLIARDIDDAYEVLNRSNANFYNLTIDYAKTLSLSKKLPLKELSRFYETIAKRLINGNDLITGLDSAKEFIKDVRLKIYITMLLEAVSNGNRIGKSMEMAGFPLRHAKAISAMEESGEVAGTLLNLAKECKRERMMQTNIASLTRMPKIFGFLVFVMFYGAFGFMSPMMLGKLEEIVGYSNMPLYARNYFDFVTLFSDNLIISSIIYFGVFLALFYFVKSQAAKNLANKVPIVNKISERGDLASLWLKYGLMFSAGMNPQESADLVAESAKRKDSRESFFDLKSYLESGQPMSTSVELSGFPDYVLSFIKAGESSDSLSDSMNDMSIELFEDVDFMIEQLSDTVQLVMLILMVLVVLLFFLLTYYPLLSTMMSQL